MSTDQGQPSRYIFEKKEGFFDHNLSEPITDTTHVYMQKSNGTFPVKAQKTKERLHTPPLGFCYLRERNGRAVDTMNEC